MYAAAVRAVHQCLGNCFRACAERCWSLSFSHRCCHESGLEDAHRKGFAVAAQQQAFTEDGKGRFGGSIHIIAGASPVAGNRTEHPQPARSGQAFRGGDGREPGEQAGVIGRRDGQGFAGIITGSLRIAQGTSCDQVEIKIRAHVHDSAVREGCIIEKIGGFQADLGAVGLGKGFGDQLIAAAVACHQVKAPATSPCQFMADGLGHETGAAEDKRTANRTRPVRLG